MKELLELVKAIATSQGLEFNIPGQGTIRADHDNLCGLIL